MCYFLGFFRNVTRFHLRYFGKNTPKRGIGIGARIHVARIAQRWFGIGVTLVCGNLYRYTCERRYLNRNLEINVSSPCSKRTVLSVEDEPRLGSLETSKLKRVFWESHDDDATFSARTISATAFSSRFSDLFCNRIQSCLIGGCNNSRLRNAIIWGGGRRKNEFFLRTFSFYFFLFFFKLISTERPVYTFAGWRNLSNLAG